MKEQGRFAVCYDISDDGERYRVDKTLRGFGFRVQKSVWEMRLSRGDKAALMQKLDAINVQTGSVKIYRIYGGTNDVVIGKAMIDPDKELAYVF